MGGGKKKAEIVEAKREVGENAAHSITGLYTSDGFEALVELSQYCNPVTDKIVDYEEEEHKIFLLENIIKSPYFARIDFKFDGEENLKKYISDVLLCGKRLVRKCMFMTGDLQSPVFFTAL